VVDLVTRREQRLQGHTTAGRDHFVWLKRDHGVFLDHRLQLSYELWMAPHRSRHHLIDAV
jgi:hypothetical protein